jgi:hypothetical protein
MKEKKQKPQKESRKRGFGYTHTLTASAFGITGKRSAIGTLSGLGLRPLEKKKKGGGLFALGF